MIREDNRVGKNERSDARQRGHRGGAARLESQQALERVRIDASERERHADREQGDQVDRRTGRLAQRHAERRQDRRDSGTENGKQRWLVGIGMPRETNLVAQAGRERRAVDSPRVAGGQCIDGRDARAVVP
ncbi:MAG: hypothetical protein JO225_03760 [Candidatus Eremiobacteraeota bacterium]|nr:hypothetical protein [Candidatus Eremiobacteraeota bacterium]